MIPQEIYMLQLDDLALNDRTYKCDCGNVDDRDQNAAKNIKEADLNQLIELYEGVNLLNKPTGLMPESYACGDTMTEVTWSAQESMSFRAQLFKFCLSR